MRTHFNRLLSPFKRQMDTRQTSFFQTFKGSSVNKKFILSLFYHYSGGIQVLLILFLMMC